MNQMVFNEQGRWQPSELRASSVQQRRVPDHSRAGRTAFLQEGEDLLAPRTKFLLKLVGGRQPTSAAGASAGVGDVHFSLVPQGSSQQEDGQLRSDGTHDSVGDAQVGVNQAQHETSAQTRC